MTRQQAEAIEGALKDGGIKTVSTDIFSGQQSGPIRRRVKVEAFELVIDLLEPPDGGQNIQKQPGRGKK